MRFPSNHCDCVIKVSEASKVDVSSVGVEGTRCPQDGSLARLIINAFQVVRRAALAHMRYVHRFYKLKLESLPPRIGEDRIVYTGQWVGLVEYYDDRGRCVQLVIEPRYKLFHKVYEEVVLGCGGLSPSLALAVADLHLSSVGRLPAINTALFVIEEYASRNPPYLVIEEPLYSAHITPHGVLRVKRILQNERYYATLAASVSILSQAIKLVSTHLASSLLEVMAKSYAELQRKLLSILATNLQVIEALHGYWYEEPDEDVLLSVKATTHYALAPGEGGVARFLLTPTPKIYEIYVLVKIAEALRNKYGESLEACGQTIHCYQMEVKGRLVKIYYNRPPPKLSRLIYKMTGSRPHPDILVTYDGTRIVVDAKYRPGFSLTARRRKGKLKLSEALRLLGYVTDLASDTTLQLIIAVPKKVRDEELKEQLDNLTINVKLAEVSPRTGIQDLIQVLP